MNLGNSGSLIFISFSTNHGTLSHILTYTVFCTNCIYTDRRLYFSECIFLYVSFVCTAYCPRSTFVCKCMYVRFSFAENALGSGVTGLFLTSWQCSVIPWLRCAIRGGCRMNRRYSLDLGHHNVAKSSAKRTAGGARQQLPQKQVKMQYRIISESPELSPVICCIPYLARRR